MMMMKMKKKKKKEEEEERGRRRKRKKEGRTCLCCCCCCCAIDDYDDDDGDSECRHTRMMITVFPSKLASHVRMVSNHYGNMKPFPPSSAIGSVCIFEDSRS